MSLILQVAKLPSAYVEATWSYWVKYLKGRLKMCAVKPVPALKLQRTGMCWWDGELTDVISGGKAVCLSVCLHFIQRCQLPRSYSFSDECVSVQQRWNDADRDKPGWCHFIYWKSNIDWPLTGGSCPNTAAWNREGPGDNFDDPYCFQLALPV